MLISLKTLINEMEDRELQLLLSKVDRCMLKGEKLIVFAQDVISTAVDAVGGRYMMVECKDNEKLVGFYKSHGFDEIAHVPDNEQPMVQMIKRI